MPWRWPTKKWHQRSPRAEFVVKHIISDGDIVAVHTRPISDSSNLSKGGLRQIHLFRFDSDKIVEYWDITKQITPKMLKAGGAF